MLTGGGSEASEEETAPEQPGSDPSQPVLPHDLKVTAIEIHWQGNRDNTGSGFIRRSVDQLNGDGRTASLLANLAINGMTTEALLPKLDDKEYSMP